MRLWTQVRFAFQKQEARGRATDNVAEPFLTSYLLSLTSKRKKLYPFGYSFVFF